MDRIGVRFGFGSGYLGWMLILSLLEVFDCFKSKYATTRLGCTCISACCVFRCIDMSGAL